MLLNIDHVSGEEEEAVVVEKRDQHSLGSNA